MTVRDIMYGKVRALMNSRTRIHHVDRCAICGKKRELWADRKLDTYRVDLPNVSCKTKEACTLDLLRHCGLVKP